MNTLVIETFQPQCVHCSNYEMDFIKENYEYNPLTKWDSTIVTYECTKCKNKVEFMKYENSHGQYKYRYWY